MSDPARRPAHRPCRNRGVATVEFALIAPILIVLVLGIVDYARAIQANNILINMSREAANLVSRTSYTPQDIMAAVATTADPLHMTQQGSIVITRLSGRADGRADVLEQYRWRDPTNAFSQTSRIWPDCPSWVSGSCTVPTNPKPNPVSAPLTLASGEMVYTVEVYYHYTALFGIDYGALFGIAMPVDAEKPFDREMYSRTIL